MQSGGSSWRSRFRSFCELLLHFIASNPHSVGYHEGTIKARNDVPENRRLMLAVGEVEGEEGNVSPENSSNIGLTWDDNDDNCPILLCSEMRMSDCGRR